MADPLVDLTNLDAASDYLAGAGATPPDDDVLEALITAVSAQIQSYLNRRIPSQTYAVRLHGRRERAIFLPNYPITAVLSLAVNGQLISPSLSVMQSGYVF